MSRNRQQHRWDAVRSQIQAHLARCDALEDETAPERSPVTPFHAGDGEPYYGPTREARLAMNQILQLHAAAARDQWDAALAESGNRERLVGALGDPSVDVESRSAIALLLLETIDRLAQQGCSGTELMVRLRWHLSRDPRVQSRMRYWWTHLDCSAPVIEALA